jgi:multidrug resistance efflux pump
MGPELMEAATSPKITAGSYSEKVKSLRLGSSNEIGTSAGKHLLSLLGWSLAIAATGTSLLLGYKAFRDPGQPVGVSAPETAKTSSGPSAKSPAVASSAASLPTGPKPTSDSPDAIVLENKGYIIPVQLILVSPKVGGMLTKMNIKEGDIVAKDTVLAELETDEYLADFRRAEAYLRSTTEKFAELKNGARKEEKDQAELELQEARRQLTQLELELARGRRLAGTAAALSARELEQAQYQYEAQEQRVKRLASVLELIRIGPRQERIRAAEADMRQAEADLAKARWRLSNCTIKAPVSGMILSKKAEEGNIVSPGAFNGSYSLCEMADLNNLEVELDIQERDISKVKERQSCQVLPEAWQADPGFLASHPRGYEGFVSRIMPQANRSKGAIPVRVKIVVPPGEQGRFLKPEMGALVTFFNATYGGKASIASSTVGASNP